MDRPRWERLLNLDFLSTAAMVKSLPVVVPVTPIGYSDDDEADHDPLISGLWPGESH